MMSIFLLLMGLFVNAPLEELANGNVTPAVAKAPWYFLGLQELLAYFHPTVAGVLVPTFVLVGAALIPYVDRGNILATRPSQRKTAVVLFTLFCILGLVVTFVGIFFRGPGYAFVIPYLTFFPIGAPASTSPSDRTRTRRMSNYQVEPADKPQALTKEALKALRHEQVQGMSRRQLLRGSLGGGVGLWLLEVTAGTLGFLWPNLQGRLRRPGQDRDLRRRQAGERHPADRPGLPGLLLRCAGVRRPDRHRASSSSSPGEDTTGDGTALNVRALYQRCPHLGCKPEPVPQELLDRVPLPRLALRPARDQGARAAVRPGAARHGPLLGVTVDGDGVADARHRQDHPRPAARRARPAGPHPAEDADRMHLTVTQTADAARGDR